MKTVDELKVDCLEMLIGNEVKATTKKGRDMIYAFWMGALAANGSASPYVTICLMSGRYEDLVAKEES